MRATVAPNGPERCKADATRRATDGDRSGSGAPWADSASRRLRCSPPHAQNRFRSQTPWPQGIGVSARPKFGKRDCVSTKVVHLIRRARRDAIRLGAAATARGRIRGSHISRTGAPRRPRSEARKSSCFAGAVSKSTSQSISGRGPGRPSSRSPITLRRSASCRHRSSRPRAAHPSEFARPNQPHRRCRAPAAQRLEPQDFGGEIGVPAEIFASQMTSDRAASRRAAVRVRAVVRSR